MASKRASSSPSLRMLRLGASAATSIIIHFAGPSAIAGPRNGNPALGSRFQIQKVPIFRLVAVMFAFAAALVALTSCSSISNLFQRRTMAGLQNAVETKWIYNSAWKSGSLPDFEKQFGKPDVVDANFFEAAEGDTDSAAQSSAGAGSEGRKQRQIDHYTALYYQCSDGLILLLSENVTDAAGRKVCRHIDRTDCLEINVSQQIGGKKTKDIKGWAGPDGSLENLDVGSPYMIYNLQ